MKTTLCRVLLLALVLSALLPAATVGANPPAPEDRPGAVLPPDTLPGPYYGKPYDRPEPLAHQRLMERQRLLENGQLDAANTLAITGTDRVLVILVEFAGSDTVTWNAGDTWDPLGIADEGEWTGTVGDCSHIITQTQSFTYSGPLHNAIPRPLSEADRSGQSIWTEDFTPQWFDDFMFGNGIIFDFLRQDGSHVYADYTGFSVRDYYEDFSGNTYHIDGDVVGWLQLPHSMYWYGADQCPGARSIPESAGTSASNGGQIPGGGTSRSFVTDALDAVNAISNTIPGFHWTNYDGDGDGVIDRLWVVHAGYGEEDSTVLLNRTDYSEGSLWSHSSSLSPAYSVGQGISAGPYIRMPENGGIGVFAHEYGHNLGADDLYSYSGGDTSAGFWTLMSDDWTGFPIGYLPPSLDPWHLYNFGWLDPLVITDPTQVYYTTVGQASEFPGGVDVYRGVKIQLPEGAAPLPVTPWQGSWYWFGGHESLANGMMTLANPIALGAGSSAALTFDLAYDLEDQWDFLWVQASTDLGTTWNTLTNTDTICTHDPDWIGYLYGFPDDMCAAGIGGFTGYNPEFPAPRTETFNLTPYLGQSILLRFWYMTDWATLNTGPFMDSIQVTVNSAPVFSDDAETANANWTYAAPWIRSAGAMTFSHNYYLQWRNTGTDGGYDQALGDSRWRYGPANSGLAVWYNNNFYQDTEIPNYLFDYPSFGPKGRMLVLDSHPEPYYDPYWVSAGFNNEGGALASRGGMRDATLSLGATPDFTMTAGVYNPPVLYAGRPAVSFFDDALGYYPGAEYASRGPGYTPPSWKWITKQWDASAVVPSTQFYPLNAPGYVGTGAGQQEFRYWCTRVEATGRLSCYWLGTNVGLGYDGGTGNPGDYAGAYGWHVQVLNSTDTTANLLIWNTHYSGALMPDTTVGAQGDTVHFEYTLNDAAGAMNPLDVCIPVDDTEFAYVAGSVTGGATASSTPCGPSNSGGVPDAITYIHWNGAVAAGGDVAIGYDVTLVPASGAIGQYYYVENSIGFGTSLQAPPINIVPAAELPVAAFTPSATTVVLGAPVAFTNNSTGADPKIYEWDFGDARYSADTSPSHTFAAAGTYTVTLTVSNVHGSDTAQAAIVVRNPTSVGMTGLAAQNGALPLGALAVLAVAVVLGVAITRRRR